jgi:hypothetical protein
MFCQLDPIRSGSVVFFLDKVPLEPFAQLMIKPLGFPCQLILTATSTWRQSMHKKRTWM